MPRRRFPTDVPTWQAVTRMATIRSARSSRHYEVEFGAGIGNGMPELAVHDGTRALHTGEILPVVRDNPGATWHILPQAGAGGSSLWGEGKWEYDFDIDGGAQGDIELRSLAGVGVIPAGSYITNAVWIGETELASASDAAGVTVNVESTGITGDLIGYSNPSEFVVGICFIDPVLGFDAKQFLTNISPGQDANSYIKTTADRVPTMHIDNEDVTAGKFVLLVRWVTP